MNDISNTITPVYFPFTFISDKLLREITTFWSEVVVYQPSKLMMSPSFQPWIDQGSLKIRTPLAETTDEKRLKHALRSFQDWGEMHHKSDIEYLKAANAASPYLDTMTSGIVADLKSYMDSSRATSASELDDREFSAQLFLHLAQDYDQRSSEVIGGIEEFERNQELFKEVLHPFSEEDGPLKGGECGAVPVITSDEEPAVFMTGQRIHAWNHLFQQDGYDTDFLFTDSREALSLLLGEECEKLEILQCRPDTPFSFYSLFFELMTEKWSDAMRAKVNNATRDSNVAEGQNRVLLRCYLLPDQSARTLLGKACSPEGNVLPAGPQSDTKQRNALIVLLERVGRT
ncbi:MAG: hypothetical protein JRE23_07460 [Deltaproteobacteria bacterium]|nr:hypothetical protein [Deltaproteobacteria bacterium]